MPNKPYYPEEEKLEQKGWKISYWYVTHKVLLRRILIVALIVFSAMTLGYGIWGFLDYFVLSRASQRQMIQEILYATPLTQDWISTHAPRPIESSNVYTFAREDKYDFLTKIENASPYYWAEFDYKFVFSGGQTPVEKSFILPGQEKWLALLSFSGQSRPTSARLEIENISWHRIDVREIGDYAVVQAERLNFEITDVEYVASVALDKQAFAKTKFSARNLSAYGYWSVGFYIIAYRGATPAGVNFVALDRFASGEKRTVEVSWFDTLSQVSKIEVEAELNILDETNYMSI
ncbi:hypothetical protein KJ969_01490 [Patescibacteria group bacterium]|nr:hypothetical protein [Patescibacteria group bacterium]MBU1921891.1 hypothetical protein [Patescibacteria group bacterium]